MSKTSEEVLNGLLSTSLKLDEQGVTALKEADGSWKDDALDLLLKADADRVTALKGDVDKLLTERGAKVKREVMEELERDLRDEFGVKDVPAKGKDLVKHIVQVRAKAGETLTEDQVKAHPLYLAIEEQTRAFPKTLEEKIKERETALKTEFKTKAQTQQAVAKGKTIFQGMRPILPKNAEVAAAQMTLLENHIASQPLQFVEDARGNLVDIIPMKADGSGRLEDAHGHPIKYEDFVRTGAARFFEFEQGERKNGAPDPNGTGNGGGGEGDGATYDPKTVSAYATAWQTINADVSMDMGEKVKQWALLKAAGVKNGVASA